MIINRQATTQELELTFEQMLNAYATGNDEQFRLILSNFEAEMLKFLDETDVKHGSRIYQGNSLIQEATNSYRIG